MLKNISSMNYFWYYNKLSLSDRNYNILLIYMTMWQWTMTCVTLCHTLLFNSEKGKNKTKLKNKNKREKNEITKFPLVNSNMEKRILPIPWLRILVKFYLINLVQWLGDTLNLFYYSIANVLSKRKYWTFCLFILMLWSAQHLQ